MEKKPLLQDLLMQHTVKDGKQWLVPQMPPKPSNAYKMEYGGDAYLEACKQWQAECHRLSLIEPILCAEGTVWEKREGLVEGEDFQTYHDGERLIVTNQDPYAEHWAEAYEEMAKYDEECDRINNRIFKAIKRQIGEGFMADLGRVIEEGECKGAFSFSEEAGGKFYQQSGYGCIVGYWVEQHSVGDSGDCFAGTIWVRLKASKYLEMPFSC